MRIALVQMRVEPDLAANLESSLAAIDEAADAAASLVCFPEIHLSPFFPQYRGFDASPYLISIGDDAVLRLREKARARGAPRPEYRQAGDGFGGPPEE